MEQKEPSQPPPPPQLPIINEPNNFISSVICDNEDEKLHELDLHYIFIVDEKSENNVNTSFSEKDTHEIHIVKKRQTPTKPSNESEIINKINEKIKKLCNLRNIIIYVLLSNSSVRYNNFIELFNEFLRKTLPIKYYSNIIIFNFFDTKYLKFQLPIYIQYSLCNKYCVSNINDRYDNSKKFFQVANVFCNSSFSRTIFIHPEKNQKYVYKFIHSSELYNYEYLKSLIMERRCSSGKLIQFTGTCWINALLNALFLPKSSRKYMIEQCHKYIESEEIKNKTKLQDIYNLKQNLTYGNILTSIIYHIFIKKEHPSKNKQGIENDFILTFADKIKRIWAKKNIIYLSNEEKKLFTNNDVEFGMGGTPECTISTLTEILRNYLKDFQYMYRVFIFKLPSKFTDNEIARMEKLPLEKRIKKGSSYYQLTSCLLSQSQGKHLICGFICEGKEYLYNSNYKKAIECNWTKYEYKPYIDYNNGEINIYNKHNNKPFVEDNTLYMEVLIYTVETIVDIENDETAIDEVEEEAKTITIPDVPCNLPPPPSLPSLKPTKPTKQSKKCQDNQELIDGKCRVKCNENQTRHLLTRRCRKNTDIVNCKDPNQELIDGKCRLKCNENQRRNPLTRRCRKIKKVNINPLTI